MRLQLYICKDGKYSPFPAYVRFPSRGKPRLYWFNINNKAVRVSFDDPTLPELYFKLDNTFYRVSLAFYLY